MSSPRKPSEQTGGVNITGTTGPVGDILGRDKITFVTPAGELAAILEAGGALRPDQQDNPLSRLANPIDAFANWDDIVLEDDVRKELVEIVDKFRFGPELVFPHFSSAWPSGDNPEDILVGDEA
jgi:hypothetical protein